MDYKVLAHTASLGKGSTFIINVLRGGETLALKRRKKSGFFRARVNRKRRVASVPFGLASNSAEMYP